MQRKVLKCMDGKVHKHAKCMLMSCIKYAGMIYRFIQGRIQEIQELIWGGGIDFGGGEN